ncbi:MAG TPA: PepSY domain-containing protein [Steroidobacteraceae bacterium]|nr:PepSY domain-containing protein [Steroidobacteraceae bacterium]
MLSPRIARLGHRWLALLVGWQLAIWFLSGLYMVVVDLDFIHGDSLVRNVAPPVRLDEAIAPLAAIRAGRDDVQAIRMRVLPDRDQPVYEVVRTSGTELFDAGTGRPMPVLDEARIRALAQAYYAGRGSIAGAQLLTNAADLPGEIRGRRPPVWQIDFDDWTATSLYVDPVTGRLVTRRHRFWRWFDFLWSLHIMDYVEREDVNNPLLRIATPLAFVTVAFGGWLAFHSFGFLQRRRMRRRGAA